MSKSKGSIKLGNRIQIRIQSGNIETAKVDVIVNETNTKLQLQYGAASSQIVKEGIHQHFKAEIDVRCPSYELGTGNLIVTPSPPHGNLGCSYVYHVVTRFENHGNDKEVRKTVKSIVSKCLQAADEAKVTSIAFPPLGVYPGGADRKKIADDMLEEITNFPPTQSTLRDVLIMVHPEDERSWVAFNETWNSIGKHAQPTQGKHSKMIVQPYTKRPDQVINQPVTYHNTKQYSQPDAAARLTLTHGKNNNMPMQPTTQSPSQMMYSSTVAHYDTQQYTQHHTGHILTPTSSDMDPSHHIPTATTTSQIQPKQPLSGGYAQANQAGQQSQMASAVNYNITEHVQTSQSVRPKYNNRNYPDTNTGRTGGVHYNQQPPSGNNQVGMRTQPLQLQQTNVELTSGKHQGVMDDQPLLQTTNVYARQNKNNASQPSVMEYTIPTPSHGIRVVVLCGDILNSACEGMVHATDSHFGFNGAVGKQIYSRTNGHCAVRCENEVLRSNIIKITKEDQFRFKYIVHTDVKTMTSRNPSGWVDTLSICLQETDNIKGLRTVAFPLIGTGKMGLPTNVAVSHFYKACEKFASSCRRIREIQLYVFLQTDAELVKQCLSSLITHNNRPTARIESTF